MVRDPSIVSPSLESYRILVMQFVIANPVWVRKSYTRALPVLPLKLKVRNKKTFGCSSSQTQPAESSYGNVRKSHIH